MLSLGQAAKLANTSKTSLTRAIKSGKLSATRHDDGSYAIDPSELARVFEVFPDTPVTGNAGGDVVSRVTPSRDREVTPVTLRDPELASRLAVAEAELNGARALLAEVRDRLSEAQSDRDDWRQKAESSAERERALLTDQRKPQASWWRRWRGAA